ncbi:hypothetical protein D5086_010614 [Populus alba]|uniref:Uncharacterized protein n=1 Tax=Populus alba TaxID=43335 RepID=A0ACC4CA57_POPAL
MQSLYHQTGGDIDQKMAMKFDPLPFLVFYYQPTVTKQHYTSKFIASWKLAPVEMDIYDSVKVKFPVVGVGSSE